MTFAVFVAGTVLAAATAPANASPTEPGTVPVPVLGWNSWNSGIPLNENTIRETVDAMIASGMRDAGYRYVNLDAGWAAPERDSHGDLQADPEKFPHGMAAVADYVHDHGMLLGLYSSPYNQTCGQTRATAGLGHEAQDARQFAAWGVDFLKYDWCHADSDHNEQVDVFTAMRDELRATGRAIVYSINPNSSDDADAGTTYDWSTVADMTRSTGDLIPLWRNDLPPAKIGGFDTRGFVGVIDQYTTTATGNRIGLDPDMLVVGITMAEFLGAHTDGMPAMAAKQGALSTEDAEHLGPRLRISPQLLDLLRRQDSLTIAEQRAHFALWAMLGAPLIAGNDVRTMSAETRDILTNREVIAIDQDPTRAPGAALPDDHRIIVKPLADGSVAVALHNDSDRPATIETTTAATGLATSEQYRVRDLWAHTTTTTTGPITAHDIPPHGVALVRVTP
ncbi:glycoside hydrolase family 27 protein [Nocardia abscessus]|uniref:Alpha-galactosidase n=1 Tax=Nocardia abscessus TaxID=120957 RepID=A0ABS0C3L4_9NOCA|nr:glycoside hydrolase family 27 protein [Nocardia abscessus]MBF6224231.1 glycoside hydrolase family 27 protein [Nocardia abscessus]